MTLRHTIFLLLPALFALSGCHERERATLDRAFSLVDDHPDSVLNLLGGIDRYTLGATDEARYALVYTIAQDKTGLDVADDSLMRIAYNYYGARPDDSLYARSMYYMGKYYKLTDSIDKATSCMQKAVEAAEKQGDGYTLCLALERLSDLIVDGNPQLAIHEARRTDSIYSSLPKANIRNKVYHKLNVSVMLSLADSLQQAESECRKALALATAANDSDVLSDVYQDMSLILSEKGDTRGAVEYSRLSNTLSSKYPTSKQFNLAMAYLEADSLAACLKVLDHVRINKPLDHYMSCYFRLRVAIKMKDADKTLLYADSTCICLETMYADKVADNAKYYKLLLESENAKGRLVERGRMQAWLIAVVAIAAAAIILLIIFSHRQYKKRSLAEIRAEKEKRMMEERVHTKEMSQKEMQLSTMRSYILRKIDIASKIKGIKAGMEKVNLLSDDDWEEIRLFVDGMEDNFVTRLSKRFPLLTSDDLRLLTLLRLHMPTKVLASIYGISEKSVKQKLFVFKAKVGIEGQKQSLRQFVEGL